MLLQYFSIERWFESQLILNDFDSVAIAGVDQLCEPSVLRLGREGEGWGESYSQSTMNRLS